MNPILRCASFQRFALHAASTSDPGWRTMRRPSIGSFLNTLAAAVSGADPAAEEDLDDVQPRAGPRQPGDVDVTTLDTCTFGPHRLTLTPRYCSDSGKQACPMV